MPKGEKNRKLSPSDINEIVRLYTTKLEDGTWIGTPTLARQFGVRPATIRRWLRLRGVTMRSAREAHSGGKRCKPITSLPTGEPPLCRCGCGARTEWLRPKNRWRVYIVGHQWPHAPYKDAEWLREQYVDRNRTMANIGTDWGVNAATIGRYLRRFGIPARDMSAARIGRQTGEKNPAWKGGVADWSYSSDWKRIAREIRNRDEWRCQDCGERRVRWGVHLHVHHIDGDKLNNDPTNLVSLCAGCHHERHRTAA